MKRIFCIFSGLAYASLILSANTLIVGIDASSNLFPFGGPTSGLGTRYQEAYDSSLFSGPILITGIDFFSDGGALYAGTYQLSFSTFSAGVNTLSTTNFDGNLGADNTLFDTATLSGLAPGELTFTGTPFLYNPADGNLLLDIQIAPTSSGETGATFEDGSGIGPSTIARYQNFGNPNSVSGFGLVTEFDFSNPVPEPATFGLVCCGLLGICIRRLRRN